MSNAVEPWDQQRFCALVAQHQTALLRTCYVILKDAHLAEDAVQETFWKAYRAGSAFRGECNEKTWLMRIAINTCRDMRRRAWFRWVDRRITPEQLPEACVPFSEKEDMVILSIMALPSKEREVLLLYYYQNMTMQEIGQALHLSAATISIRLAKARQTLKAVLEGNADE